MKYMCFIAGFILIMLAFFAPVIDVNLASGEARGWIGLLGGIMILGASNWYEKQ